MVGADDPGRFAAGPGSHVHRAAAVGFERGAQAYERSRPSYPEPAVELVADVLGAGPGRSVLDLAAGTGKFTRLLIPTGAAVVAVEPVAAMRAELHQSLPAVTVLDGTAEAIPLDDGSVDGAVAAQAFHWFDAPAALAEIHRVLRPEGRLALVWNVRDASVDWVRRFEEVMVAAAGNKPYEPSVDWAAVVAAAGGFGPLHHERFTYGQDISAELLVERAASTSYVSALDDRARRDCLDEVAELARTHPDLAGRAAVHLPLLHRRVLVRADLTPFQAGLLTWTATTRRDLPWRDTRDPWAVLVSELMLQQTQVERVVPKYRAFLRRFPTVASCAASGVGEVVTLWSGLGYNRRAVNLHRSAGLVVKDHGGRLPCDLDALLALPGIGPYTARALLAFAWDREVGVVDTNAARVLARTEGRSLRGAEVQALADRAVPAGQGWAWNQAMLDLGATVCRARAPECTRCPVASACAWHLSGRSAPDPARGSAGTSTGQSRFEGSDRQGRGRLVDRLRHGGRLDPSAIADAAGWPDDPARTAAAVASLVRDGLAVEHDDGSLTLP